MKWYTAECLFRSMLHGVRPKGGELFEHRYFLLRAGDDRSAKKKARELAKKKQHSYLNGEGIKVEWVLESVEDVKEILSPRLAEGTEVFHKYSSKRNGKNSR